MRTVVTWRRYTDTLPPRSGEYLVICRSAWITTLTYNKEHEAFCWSEDSPGGIEVVYWAEKGSIDTLQREVRQENLDEWNKRR